MAGFKVQTDDDNPNDDENLKVILFHDRDFPSSMIQKSAVENMDTEAQVEIVDIERQPSRFRRRGVQKVPTTILTIGDTEAERWEGPTHEDNILPKIQEQTQ